MYYLYNHWLVWGCSKNQFCSDVHLMYYLYNHWLFWGCSKNRFCSDLHLMNCTTSDLSGVVQKTGSVLMYTSWITCTTTDLSGVVQRTGSVLMYTSWITCTTTDLSGVVLRTVLFWCTPRVLPLQHLTCLELFKEPVLFLCTPHVLPVQPLTCLELSLELVLFWCTPHASEVLVYTLTPEWCNIRFLHVTIWKDQSILEHPVELIDLLLSHVAYCMLKGVGRKAKAFPVSLNIDSFILFNLAFHLLLFIFLWGGGLIGNGAYIIQYSLRTILYKYYNVGLKNGPDDIESDVCAQWDR